MQTMTVTKGFVAGALIEELCAMVENDPHKGTEHEAAFLGDATRGRTVAIGKALHKIGGEDLMSHACSVVYKTHGWSGRSLDMAWNGIGEWLG